MKTLIGAVSLLALAATCPSAEAADCAPLKILNSIPMQSAPAGRMLVPVSINGTSEMMLLDTDSDRTLIGKIAADELKLPQNNTRKKILGGGGNISQTYVTIDKLLLGNMQAKDMTFFVSPDPNLGKGQPFIGELAPDLMSKFDVEMDFAALKLNYFSTDHCDGQVVYWKTPAIAVIPFHLDGQHISFKITLNGRTIIAAINTASSRTTLLAPAAQRIFDLTADSPGVTPLPGPDNKPEHRAFSKEFDTLAFGGVSVGNPRIVVVPDLLGSNDPYNTAKTGSNLIKNDDDINKADLAIGMDVLKHLHIYIAFNERNIYVTPAGTGDAVAGAQPVSSPVP